MLHRRFLGAFALCASLLVSLPAAAQSYLQCVPFARSESGVEIRGNAKTWWAQAAGEYKRGHEPRKGAVMAFAATRGLWDQTLVSETPETYRAEYLAASILAARSADELRDADLLRVVREAAADRYDEGYERGVHDHDAARILEVLLRLHADAGLLRYPSSARAAAQLFWTHGPDDAARAHEPGSPLIVEWRSLTVALLDRLAPLVRERLGKSADEFPLGNMLEGGTWAAGRELAARLRDGSPPLTIVSDGTVF